MNVNKININQSEPTYYIASDIYDVTANNNDTTFSSLSELLSAENLSTLIPSVIRCGGMSIRFIQSSDNKYVQYRLMTNEFSTTIADWEGVDDEPTAGSDNLVKSGGVARIIGFPMTLSWEGGSINSNTGYDFFDEQYLTTRQRSGYISVNYIDTIIGATSTFEITIYQYDASKNYLQCSPHWISKNKYVFTEELDYDCKYIRILSKTIDSQLPPIQLENSKSLYKTVGAITSDLELVDKTLNSVIPIWQAGSINSDNGTNNDDEDYLTTRRRTWYIKAQYNEIFDYQSPYSFNIYQYDDNYNYIGLAAYFNNSNGQFTFDKKCTYIRLMCVTTNEHNTPTLKLKASSNKSVINNLSILDSGVNVLKSNMYGIVEHTTQGVVWEKGGIDTNAGNIFDTEDFLTIRQRTQNFIPIQDCDEVTNYTPPFNYMVHQYAQNKTYLGHIPDNWCSSDWNFKNSLDVNCYYIKISCITTDSTTPTIVLKKSAQLGVLDRLDKIEPHVKDTIIVDANGEGDYTNLTDALVNAGDTSTKHITIIVKPGTYLMPPKVSGVAPYEENNRNLTIKGDDKYLCVLYNNIGFYDYTIGTDCSPLRLNGDVRIENLTIKSMSAEFDDYVNTEGYIPRDDYRKASYCIHRDGSNQQNTKFIVKNCILIDDHMTCIGFGLKENTELIIEDVYAQSEQAAEHSIANSYGTLYGHYSTNKGLGQNISVVRCQLVNKTSNQAINIMDAKPSDATPQDTFGTFKFIDNTTDTTNNSTALVISKSNEGFYAIDALSFNNKWDS